MSTRATLLLLAVASGVACGAAVYVTATWLVLAVRSACDGHVLDAVAQFVGVMLAWAGAMFFRGFGREAVKKAGELRS